MAGGDSPLHKALDIAPRVKTWPGLAYRVKHGDMPRKSPQTAACSACREPSVDLRRGLCFRCYQRQRRGALAVGRCGICPVSDPRMLVQHARLGVLCANHARIARASATLADVERLCG